MRENNNPLEFRVLLSRGATESLDLEFKQWIDPKTPHGKSKITKACLALRNNDGGRLVIGIDDKGNPCVDNVPVNVRSTYDSDVLREIVGKYASEPFAVTVDFIDIDGLEFPAILIPSGVKTPVICKSDLSDEKGKAILRDNALYVRSITSNNRVSSSEIRKGDWERLLTICFENREADVARFVRRHLIDIFDPSLLQATATHGRNASIIQLLDDGFKRFSDASEATEHLDSSMFGYREFSFEIQGDAPDQVPNISLLQKISNNVPRVSGWNPWVILLGSSNDGDRPTVNDGRFEAFIDYSSGGFVGPHLDYWSLHPAGKGYHIRALEDDLVAERKGYKHPEPRTRLDFYLQISRVAEGIYVANSIAKTLGFDQETTQMKFAVRWKGLAGRMLSSWVEPSRSFHSFSAATQDEFVFEVNIPLNISKADVQEYVRPFIDNLFALFGGQEINEGVIAGIVDETLSRR